MTARTGSADRLFFDLSPRVKLRIAGGDRVRFLNGQITNNIHKATATNAIEACVLNAKGKMDAHLFVHQSDETFLVDANSELQSSLQSRLERYVIADDVTIEDVTSHLFILHLIGPAPRFDSPIRIVSANRFGAVGFDIWGPALQRDQIAAALDSEFKFCDENCAERLRIERGIPRWGRELTPEIIPVEANLEQRCIDYEKGCYIGQETISRMKMSGQRNKQLCGLISLTEGALVLGGRLLGGPEPKDAGWITSARAMGDRQIGLGYVKRGFNSVGTKLEAAFDDRRVEVEVAGLPFSALIDR